MSNVNDPSFGPGDEWVGGGAPPPPPLPPPPPPTSGGPGAPYAGAQYTAAPYAAAGYPGYVDPLAKSRVVAGLLGIFLGSLGIHRFYLGFTTIGVVQIVVTIVTCGIGAIWGLVEGILYLVGAGGFTTDADGRPLRE